MAMLLITIAGAGAALLIIRTAEADSASLVGKDEASYAELKESILHSK